MAKRFAELLGGSILVHSEEGKGSTFTATLPIRYAAGNGISTAGPRVEPDPTRYPLLVMKENAETLMLYEKYVNTTGFQVLPAASVEARGITDRIRPAAIVLDIMMPGGAGWDLLVDLKRDNATREIPVWVAGVHAEAEKAMALGAGTRPVESLLIIDDDVSRYLLKGMLTGTRFAVLEAAGGIEGLRMARAERPRAILLDLAMADLSGFEVLDRLKADAATRDIQESSSRQGVIGAIREALTQAEYPGKTFHA